MRLSRNVVGAAVVCLGTILTACPSDEDVTAPGRVTEFLATPANGRVILRWTNPDDVDLEGVLIRRAVEVYPEGPAAGDKVYEGTEQAFSDVNVVNGTTYYYAAFTFDAAANFSEPARTMATPRDDL